jgi:hypothetical protein
MTQVVLEFDHGALSPLRKGPKEFADEVKTAAVVQRRSANIHSMQW